MKDIARYHLQARLFLHAVFPALNHVIHVSEPAQALLREHPFSLSFRTRSGIRASYHFSEQGCDFLERDTALSGIALFFLSDKQAANTFLEKPALPPLPLRGFSELGRMKTFIALTGIMREWLEPTPERLTDPAFQPIFAKLSLGVALRGVRVLCRYERHCRNLLAEGPQGLVVFQVEGQPPLWMNLVSDDLRCGSGEPPAAPAATVIFRDSDIAARAVLNQADTLAAVGRGEIEIHGLAPLADHLNALMERVEPYVKPQPASA